jgi:DNA-binding winged helix-turn-helix (wHTH) protein
MQHLISVEASLIDPASDLQLKKRCRKSAALEQEMTSAISDVIRVGEWSFSPERASLSRGDERRRLEHRAAKVLELLCRRQGAPVKQGELIEAVWSGRALSHNSVAVVIADLRRALDDDTRNPRFIETIPKRGYRMAAPVEFGHEQGEAEQAGAVAAPKRLGVLLFLLLALLLGADLAGWAYIQSRSTPQPFTVVVGDFPNETGIAEFDSLTPAVTELVATELARLDGLRVVRGDTGSVDARVHGRIILWTGDAAVALHAEDPRSGAVPWSGMASGPSNLLPRQVRDELDEFGQTIRRRRSIPGS